MPDKDKKIVEAARFGVWTPLLGNCLVAITKMGLGQAGEVDRRQRAEYLPPEFA